MVASYGNEMAKVYKWPIYLTSLALYSSALQQSVGLPIRDTCTLQAIAVYRLMYVYKYVVHRVVASWLLIIPSVNQMQIYAHYLSCSDCILIFIHLAVMKAQKISTMILVL